MPSVSVGSFTLPGRKYVGHVTKTLGEAFEILVFFRRSAVPIFLA